MVPIIERRSQIRSWAQSNMDGQLIRINMPALTEERRRTSSTVVNVRAGKTKAWAGAACGVSNGTK